MAISDLNTIASYGVDIDAVAGWLGSYGGEDSTSDISRGKESPLSCQQSKAKGYLVP